MAAINDEARIITFDGCFHGRTIATISEYSTLEPGDLIAMGTPPGVGHAKTPPRWLRPGEVIDIEIEGIGICSNPIVAEEMLAKTEAAE